MTDLPSISIITACRNSEATLERAIKSLIDQNYPKLEYIVLDAASTDKTIDIITKYAAHISQWRSHKDDGPNATYNEGIAKASGDIIALLNSDDWYEPGILEAVGRCFAQSPHCRVVTCEASVWRDTPDDLKITQRFTGESLNISPYATPMPNARFFHREIFQKYGNFLVHDCNGKHLIASDLEFLLRLSVAPPPHRILHQPGYNYYASEHSLTFAKDESRERQMYAERAWFAEKYLAEAPAEFRRRYGRRLRRWHRRGTTRAFFWYLQEGEYKKAMKQAGAGLRISGTRWVLDALRLLTSGIFIQSGRSKQ